MSDRDNIGFALGILGGIVGGVVAGLLFAPKSGEETRRELKQKIDELSEKYSPEVSEIKKQALHSLDNMKCRLERKYAKINEGIKAKKLAKAKVKETQVYEI